MRKVQPKEEEQEQPEASSDGAISDSDEESKGNKKNREQPEASSMGHSDSMRKVKATRRAKQPEASSDSAISDSDEESKGNKKNQEQPEASSDGAISDSDEESKGKKQKRTEQPEASSDGAISDSDEASAGNKQKSKAPPEASSDGDISDADEESAAAKSNQTASEPVQGAIGNMIMAIGGELADGVSQLTGTKAQSNNDVVEKSSTKETKSKEISGDSKDVSSYGETGKKSAGSNKDAKGSSSKQTEADSGSEDGSSASEETETNKKADKGNKKKDTKNPSSKQTSDSESEEGSSESEEEAIEKPKKKSDGKEKKGSKASDSESEEGSSESEEEASKKPKKKSADKEKKGSKDSHSESEEGSSESEEAEASKKSKKSRKPEKKSDGKEKKGSKASDSESEEGSSESEEAEASKKSKKPSKQSDEKEKKSSKTSDSEIEDGDSGSEGSEGSKNGKKASKKSDDKKKKGSKTSDSESDEESSGSEEAKSNKKSKKPSKKSKAGDSESEEGSSESEEAETSKKPNKDGSEKKKKASRSSDSESEETDEGSKGSEDSKKGKKTSKKSDDKKKSPKKATKEDDGGSSSEYESLSEEVVSMSSEGSGDGKGEKKGIAVKRVKVKEEMSFNHSIGDFSSEPPPRRGSNFVGRRQGRFTEYYRIQDQLGKGSFASVYSAKNKETGVTLAAKEMKKSPENEPNNKLVLQEFEILKDLDHPNIIVVYVSIDNDMFTYYLCNENHRVAELFENEEFYVLVSDICKGESLTTELMDEDECPYSEKRAAETMKQILSCVDYFHGVGVVHRDLKDGNILLEEDDPDRIRIIDFGMATRCEPDEKLSETVGTVEYMAPEVLGMSYSYPCDIWSCGVILFLLLSGKQPFKGSTNEETFANIVNGEFSFSDEAWESVSLDAKDCVYKLLTWDASLRPTAAQALEHPWIASNGTSRVIKTLEPPKKEEVEVTKPPEKTEVAEPPEKVEAVETKKEKEEVEIDAESKLKDAACTFIASQLLPKSEKSKIKAVFQTIDGDKDGKLTRSEVQVGYAEVFGKDLSIGELDSAFKLFDAAGSETLDYAGFVLGALDKKNLLSRENLATKVFQIFDKDKTGDITMQEFKDLLKFDLSLEKKAVKKISAEMGKNADDKVSFDEFLQIAGIPAALIEAKTPAPTSEADKVSNAEAESEEPLSDPATTESEDPATTESEDPLDRSEGSLSIKLSATQFVSHRLGKLTEHYEIVEFIAKGSYGTVCSALHKESGTVRAVKELKKAKKNKAKNEQLLKEFHILKKLSHPNIIQMHEVCRSFEGGDLHREIKKRGTFEEQDAAILMKQIFICLNYLHKNNVIHRDLKPGNVLLEEHKNLNHIKLIDFGEAIVSKPTIKLTELAGTMSYMAPEVLGMSYGQKCDVWSCGVIAFIVLTGKQPFKGETDKETFTNIVSGAVKYDDPVWESLSDESQEFVKLLLTWDETQRPTAVEALKHPWLKMKRRVTPAGLRDTTMQALANLEAFDAQSKLKIATCTFIASQLMDREEKEKIDDVFRAIDLNHDGSLNREEVKLGYEKYFGKELTDQEIDTIFLHVDADGTGELEYSEFLFGAMDKQNLLSKENLKKAFRIFDVDDDGDLTKGELKTLLGEALTDDDSVDERALNKLIAQVDLDGDGKISYKEFVSMALGPQSGSLSSLSHDEKENKEANKPEEKPDEVQKKDVESPKDDVAADKSVPLVEEPPKREPETKETKRDDESTLDDPLLKRIARASQKQPKVSRSNRDPPINRAARRDPPTDPHSVENGALPDPPRVMDRVLMKAARQVPLEPYSRDDIHRQPLQQRVYRKPGTSQAVRNLKVSPRVKRIEEACEGFDRVQEKIARLRVLLSSQDAVSKQPRPFSTEQRVRIRKPGKSPNVETLDSAFAKLNQIQSKMRALQTLVKSNQIR
ncbi:MAP kinase-activated protein kinase 2 (Fragment) [Seminavis robusta]|uniref:MAP kinase-activated protein kinase 2 n=1 Tax=Seminavis robusta TaxID=568900 RepID=A0A9N8HAA7_9STRA